MKADPGSPFKYWAFISYSHADEKWGRWLHRALERYRTPRRLVGRASRDGAVPRRLYPVFRDREELPGSVSLSDNIQDALRRSRYLVVIASPRSAISRWVNKEIVYFKSLGREDRVLCFIIDGEPNATDKPHSGLLECFPEAIRFRIGPEGRLTDKSTEPVAPDARPHGDGKRHARLKLIAGLIGVDYDELARRERQRRIWQFVRVAAAACLAAVAGTWWWLRHAPGQLDVEVEPAAALLQVNGAPFGSRIDRLDFAQGAYTVRAAMAGYYERTAALTVRRGVMTSAYLSLDPVQPAWPPIQRKDVQGAFLAMGDVDGDGVDDFAHNFGRMVGIVSGATGRIVAELPTPGPYSFPRMDLGGALGRVALATGRTRVVGGQFFVYCIGADPRMHFPAWTWEGAPSRWGGPTGTPVGDQNGDGVSEIVVTGVGDEFYLLDGASGRTVRTLKFGISEWGGTPALVRCQTPQGDGLLFCGWTATQNPDSGSIAKTFHGGLVLLGSGRLVWEKDFPGAVGDPCVNDVDGDGHSVLAVATQTQWQLCDGATGAVRSQGVLPAHAPDNDLLNFTFARSVHAGGIWIMSFRAGSGRKPSVTSVRMRDGAVLWTRSDLRPMGPQFDDQGNHLLPRMDAGVLFRTETSVVCLDPDSGKTIWEEPTASGVLSGFVQADRAGAAFYVGGTDGAVRCMGPHGVQRWGVDFAHPYNPAVVLRDAKHPDLERLVLYTHFGTERNYNEIACVVAHRDQGWSRTLKARLEEDAPNPGPPQVLMAGQRPVVAALMSTQRGQPDFAAFDAADGTRRWTASELFETAYNRFDPDRPGAGAYAEAAPAAGTWGGQEAFALMGREPGAMGSQPFELLVYRAADGKLLSSGIPIEPQSPPYAAACLADANGDGATDFVVVRPHVIGPGPVYLAGDVVAVGGAEKRQIWRTELNEPVAVAVAQLSAERSARIWVTQRDGTVCALDGADGHVLWRTAQAVADGRVVLGGPTAGPLIYAVGADGTVRELDPATGVVRARATLDGVTSACGPAAVADPEGLVVIAARDAGIVAMDASTLRLKWRMGTAGAVSVPPVVADVGGTGGAKVVACTDAGRVVMLDVKTGDLLSNEALPGAPTKPVGDLALLPASGGRPAELLVMGEDGTLRAKLFRQ